jgi:hypothetical protein
MNQPTNNTNKYIFDAHLTLFFLHATFNVTNTQLPDRDIQIEHNSCDKMTIQPLFFRPIRTTTLARKSSSGNDCAFIPSRRNVLTHIKSGLLSNMNKCQTGLVRFTQLKHWLRDGRWVFIGT